MVLDSLLKSYYASSKCCKTEYNISHTVFYKKSVYSHSLTLVVQGCAFFQQTLRIWLNVAKCVIFTAAWVFSRDSFYSHLLIHRFMLSKSVVHCFTQPQIFNKTLQNTSYSFLHGYILRCPSKKSFNREGHLYLVGVLKKWKELFNTSLHPWKKPSMKSDFTDSLMALSMP